MATIFSHAAVPLGLALAAGPPLSPRLTTAAALCAVAPDFDCVGFALGIPYDHLLGHRGLSHSLLLAALVGGAGALLARRLEARPWVAGVVLFVCLASHGGLDALTNGGLGVAFFSPFSNERYFLPWRVLEVPAIGFRHLFTPRALAVLYSELCWVWAPCLAVGLLGMAWRRWGRGRDLGPGRAV